MAEIFQRKIRRLRDNPQLLRHYLVEALAPTDIAEVSRRARGSKLQPIHPGWIWTSRVFDTAVVAGYTYSQFAAGAVAVHLIFAKGAEAAGIVVPIVTRKAKEIGERYGFFDDGEW